MNLYITSDQIGIETGGGSVTKHESTMIIKGDDLHRDVEVKIQDRDTVIWYDDNEIHLSSYQAFQLKEFIDRESRMFTCALCGKKIRVGWDLVFGGRLPAHLKCVRNLTTLDEIKHGMDIYTMFGED